MFVGLAKVMIFRIRSACSIPSNSNVDIDGCSFSGISNTNDGGVVLIRNDYSLQVKNTMFFNISAGKGGAIFHESNGNCNVSNVCGSNVRAQNNYHFSLIKLNNGNAVNGFQMVSFTYCSRNSEGSFTVLFQYGHHAFLNCNASENMVQYDGVAKFDEFQSLDAGFCTFYGNHYSGNNNHNLVVKSSIPSIVVIRKSNFISNKGGSINYVAFFEWNSAKYFIECIFVGNTGYLFSVSGGGLTLTSCVIDHAGFSSSASIITSSCVFTSTPSYSLTHFITYYCPFIPTPAPSPNETPSLTPPASFHPTPHITPPLSFEPTPQQTPNLTPEQSYEPTPEMTNPRSYDYNCQASSLNSQTGKIAVSTVFCFVFLQ